MAETAPQQAGQESGYSPDSRRARPRARPVPGRRLPAAVPSARLAARTAPSGARELADAPRTGSLAEIVRAKRTLVVTYRRDGTSVPTPVWAAEAAGVLYVRTERTSGKVKRLRRDPRMLIAPCTKLGRPLGAPIEASGRMLVGAQELPAEDALVGRYGFGRWLFERTMDLLRIDMGYLEITPGAWCDGEPTSGQRLAGRARNSPER